MRPKNQAGLTIIELVVGIGLMALVLTLFSTIQAYVTKNTVKLIQDLENSIDGNLAERILFKDLAAVAPSYNNLTMRDKNQRQFFDFYPDIPSNFSTQNTSREVVLKDGTDDAIYILIEDVKRGPLFIYDPTAAYEIGEPPADFNTAATLTYKGLNRENFISNMRDKNSFSREEEKFWGENQLILMDTPARLRPSDSNGNIDMSVAPRSPIFVGYVKNKELVTNEELQKLFHFKDPRDASIDIDSPDKFLRLAPANGGGQPLVRLRAVKLFKYYLKKENQNVKLYKAVYRAGTWDFNLMIADNVKEFVIRRENILNKIITFRLSKGRPILKEDI